VIFSPHIPGHELPEAREEWWIARELARAARPQRAASLGLEDAAAIRRDIAATIPSYAPIATLANAGDAFQWGGERLCEGGSFPLPGGKARFVANTAPEDQLEPGQFRLSTRRGKQFNSMVQAEIDGLTGAARDHVLMSPLDMQGLGLHPDQPIRLRSGSGQFDGRARAAPMTPGNLQMFWPEANVLLRAGRVDPVALVPDYNVLVTVEAL